MPWEVQVIGDGSPNKATGIVAANLGRNDLIESNFAFGSHRFEMGKSCKIVKIQKWLVANVSSISGASKIKKKGRTA